MSCNDVASILDTHRSARLAPAERAVIDEHLAACADCAAAWHAQTELLALPVPPMPAALLERALLASQPPQRARARRARAFVVVGSVVLAGAALAAGVTIVSMATRSPSSAAAPPTVAAEPQAAEDATNDGQREQVERAGAAPRQDEPPTSVELVETALGIAPLVRHPPVYPAEALEQGLEGSVQLKFDVTAAGAVENVSIVQSSDARFEQSALDALRSWRYLPRIAAGERVRSDGIRTVIRFAMAGDRPPPDPRLEQAAEESWREYAAYAAGLEIALDRLAADDLRGAELELDELQAVFGADRTDLWNFYGYLYTVQGNYGRAIDAYETAVTLVAESGFSTGGPFVPLANLYFARHQYDMAMKTLLRSNLPGGNRLMSAEANALLQKLNALGVTEQSVQ